MVTDATRDQRIIAGTNLKTRPALHGESGRAQRSRPRPVIGATSRDVSVPVWARFLERRYRTTNSIGHRKLQDVPVV